MLLQVISAIANLHPMNPFARPELGCSVVHAMRMPCLGRTCLRMGMTMACQEWSARGKRLCQRDTPGGFTKKPCSAARPTPGCSTTRVWGACQCASRRVWTGCGRVYFVVTVRGDTRTCEHNLEGTYPAAATTAAITTASARKGREQVPWYLACL